jgi:arylsulfatase A-like enzyme
MYYATGCAHAPHQVPKEWADRYRGTFDMGWDAYRKSVFERQKEIGLIPSDVELSPRDPDVPGWDSLSDDERQLYARMMEVAGFVSHADHHFGRILDTLERIGELDNTLIVDHLRQRRLGGGRPDRLLQREALLQHGARELRGRPREDRRARQHQNRSTWASWSG